MSAGPSTSESTLVFDENLCPGSSTGDTFEEVGDVSVTTHRGRKEMITDRLALALDRCKISDRNAELGFLHQ
jgi:hypothetical protein